MRIHFAHIDDAVCALDHREIHVWTAPLDRPCDSGPLIQSERERAARFKLERVRNQFISARVHLRLILGRYLNVPPSDVPIAYEDGGKPFLAGSNLQFNVSHSESLAVYAVTRHGRIGVDVERRRAIPNAEALVERFFSPRERQVFKRLPESERIDAFFRAWTRKEAVLKSIGSGVQSLDRCDVTFLEAESEKVLRLGDDGDAQSRWFLRGWRPEEGYEAAVAVEQTASQHA